MNTAPVWDESAAQPTAYAKVKPSEPLWVNGDIANTDVKGLIHKHYREEIVYPHAVRKLTQAEWETYQQSYKHRRADLQGSAIFLSRTYETVQDEHGQKMRVESLRQAYVVGRQALGKGTRIVGAAKYEQDHFRPLFESLLIQLYPDSHEDVHVAVAHPPGMNEQNMDRMLSCVLGRHDVELPDGRRFEYIVREVLPIEESVADLQCFMLDQKGRPYNIPELELTPGTQILTLNIGGALTVFQQCIVTGSKKIEVDTDARPIKKGIQDVVSTFQTELQRDFPQLRKLDAVPQEMMHHALMSGIITISNTPFHCDAQVANAMQAIEEPVAAEYMNKFAGGVSSAAIIIGGGGGGLSFNYFKAHVLEHPYIFPAIGDMKNPDATDLTRMRFSVVHGMDRGVTLYLARNGGSHAAEEI